MRRQPEWLTISTSVSTQATYDSIDMISSAEADAATKVAVELGDQVTVWMKEIHPDFLK